VKVAGEYLLAAAPDRAYDLLQDPEVLARCMPGCDHLARTGPDEYEMRMKMVISSIQGLFAGKVSIADQDRPAGFRLVVEGNGKVGFMRGDGLLTLVPQPGGTEVRYEGEVRVGGMIAGVGQRLLDTTAKMIIKRFFSKLAAQVDGASSSGAGA